ncbi:MAG: P-loop NTPase, partial [Candidatus Latescibacteria bacterium]|nr:P-loop NTPase [Candidatus Latescibacterota bacterium]
MQGEPDRGQHIWAVGGGKGGIGKSLIASNFAIVLASLGKNVVAVDLDLGNANMHTCLGVRYPQKTLGDFLSGKVHDLNEIILDTSLYNLKFIGGSGGIMGSANPWYAQKLKLLRYLENLHVDHIVLDLGAGTSYNIIDFFLGATDHLLITTPEMTSIQSVYNFVRICMFRKLRSIFHKNSNAWSIVEKAIVAA